MKWSGLAKSVHETITVHALAAKRDRIVLALSGGLDSVVLLHLMLELQPAWEWELILGHIDHGLRPAADPGESAFCRGLAERYGLQYLEEKLALGGKSGIVSEALARDQRYAVFEKWASASAADVLMTGHHAGDQAETVLYRMLTGAGIAGLSGIPRKRGIYRRPLLDIPRSELLRYAAEHDLKYCEDSSNRDQRYFRNRIRHRLLPFLEELGFRNAESALAASAASLENAVESLAHYTQMLKEEALIEEDSRQRLDLIPFRKAAPAAQRMLLREFFKKHLSRKQAEQLQRFALSAESGSTLRMQDRHFMKDRDVLICDRRIEKTECRELLCRAGVVVHTALGDLKVQQIKAIGKGDFKISRHCACFSPELLGKTLLLRSWKAGDRMRLFGRGGEKKVSDIL
ncbi:MAG: tRNA lysidine(34) synthetase TilS, partial [Candidatus Marinimicrobia bacterium]|nr:tRNA lysidine(34) synthetase TilS [Candidatus Neomarinimicrobiota bacterium]